MRSPLTVVAIVAAALSAAGCGSSGASSSSASPSSTSAADSAGGDEGTSATESGEEPATTGETIEWEGVRAFIEYNSEGGDYGFHVEFGGEPWSSATITGPDGDTLFDLSSAGSLAEHGMAGVAFESAEFPLEELTLDQFLDRFPEGDYAFTGQSLDGRTLVGESAFTHLIPEPPEITDPVIGAEIDPDNVVVAWDLVTEPEGVEIDVYSLQLSPVDPPEDQDPIALNIDFTFEVPGTINEIRLLPELFAPGATYTYELMAITADEGNQSFSVGEFTISDDQPDIDPTAFTRTVDNPYHPLPIGAQWDYEVVTADGEVNRLEIEVLSDDKSVLGIEMTSVKETLFIDDEIEESTVSWFAQDDAGNVWLFGEIDEGYADGEVVEMSTWEAGIESALPGIIMPGQVELGQDFRVSFAIGPAGAVTERGRVVAEAETIEVSAGTFTNVRLIERANTLQGHLVDRKYYAPSVGLVFEDSDAADTDITQLELFTG